MGGTVVDVHRQRGGGAADACRADAQAVREGFGEALISALKKLSRENFSNLAPSPLLVKLEYSHPTLSQRIDAIEKGSARKQA